MELLAELHKRRVAADDGCRTMGEWVAGRLDLAPETASRLWRTTRRLERLPEVR